MDENLSSNQTYFQKVRQSVNSIDSDKVAAKRHFVAGRIMKCKKIVTRCPENEQF